MSHYNEVAAEVARMLVTFETAYPNRWHTPPMALEVWSDILADLEPEEIRAAARMWCEREKWPPTPAEIKGLVPRFCRCGKCRACGQRARARALRSGPGADLDLPGGETLDEARRRFFGRPAGPALPPGRSDAGRLLP